MNRNGNARSEFFSVKLVEVDVAAGLIENGESCFAKCFDALFAGDTGKTRHPSDGDTNYLGVASLLKDGELLTESAKIKRNGVLDILDGFLFGLSLTDATGKHGAINRPSSISIMFKNDGIIHFFHL